MLRFAAVPLALLLSTSAIAFAACGGDDNGGASDEEQIRDVVALGNELDPEICDKLTDRWLENVTGGDASDCEEQLKDTEKDSIQIEDVSVEGDEATATATIQGQPGRLLLVKEDGEWKLDDIQEGE
jgi:hypothetical protein